MNTCCLAIMKCMSAHDEWRTFHGGVGLFRVRHCITHAASDSCSCTYTRRRGDGLDVFTPAEYGTRMKLGLRPQAIVGHVMP